MKGSFLDEPENRRKIFLLIAILLIAGAIYLLSPKPSEKGASTQTTTGTDVKKAIRNVIEDATKPPAPELAGISAWINSEPLTLEKLRGKVVMIDFWTYTCINCIRTLPYLNEWHQRYGKDGFVLIGVHTPEFPFEKELDNVKMAVSKYGIKYAVALDNDYDTWRAYKNNYWPRKYLIDVNGRIRYDHIGEGAYEETEKKIQELLLERIQNATFEGIAASSIQAEKPLGLPQSPETYAGYGFARAPLGNPEGYKPDEIVDYKLPSEIPPNSIALSGSWKNNYANLQHADPNEGIMIYKFTAKKIFLVAEGIDGASEAEIYLDGEYLTKENAGEDVIIGAKSRSTIKFDEARMYRLIGGSSEYGEHELKLVVGDPHFAFYAFTFG